VSITAFAEDWQLSQFWYSDTTADALAREMISETKPGSRLACLSCPSTYFATKRPEFKDSIVKRSIRVLEFDRRFASAAGEDFVFYDYKNPLGLPESLKGSFDYLMVDPPFLSDECWARTAETVKWLAAPGAKIACCTGAIMADKVFAELGCKESRFHPQHRGGLANEFRCFVSYISGNKDGTFAWVGESSLP
jgi:hypothetical protein